MREVWQDRWREGRIGWHEAEGSALLRRHWPGLEAGRSVLVPLAGKALDMLWLAEQGLEVTGVELSEIGVVAFFEENGLEYSSCPDGGLIRFSASDLPIELCCGDYFEFRGGPFDALYERGALVAVPPEDRDAYVRHTESMLAPDALRLVITLNYDDSKVSGPPFSIDPAEVKAYWPTLEAVETRNDIETGSPKFRKAGLCEVLETVWVSAPDAE